MILPSKREPTAPRRGLRQGPTENRKVRETVPLVDGKAVELLSGQMCSSRKISYWMHIADEYPND